MAVSWPQWDPAVLQAALISVEGLGVLDRVAGLWCFGLRLDSELCSGR